MSSKLLASDYFARLDSSYQKCILELERKLNETLWHDNAAKCEIIDKFSDKYLMPKEIWDKRIAMELNLDSSENSKMEFAKLKEKALLHFYSKRQHSVNYCDPDRKLLKAEIMHHFNGFAKNNQNLIEYWLTFPHSKLNECFREFEENSWSPIPKHIKKRCKAAKELYGKIMEAESNIHEWLKFLVESEDEEFVIHNIEYRLGSDLTNKPLWKEYLQYLKGTDKRRMLKVFSKYCSFFLDDFEMQEEYQNEKSDIPNENQINDNPFVAIEESIKEEIIFHKIQNHKNFLRTCQKTIGENIQIQDFALPTINIRYLLDKGNAQILQKLFQTCKYLIHLPPKKLPCHRLIIRQRREAPPKMIFQGHSLDVTLKDFDVEMFKNFYIGNSLQFYYTLPYQNHQALSKLIAVLYQCDAKFLNIMGQNLTSTEFKFLVGSGNIKLINFYEVNIFHSNGEAMTLEEILLLTPKLFHYREKLIFILKKKMYTNFRHNRVIVTPKSSKIISSLNFKYKFEAFSMRIVGGETASSELYQELLKNVGPNFINPVFCSKLLASCSRHS